MDYRWRTMRSRLGAYSSSYSAGPAHFMGSRPFRKHHGVARLTASQVNDMMITRYGALSSAQCELLFWKLKQRGNSERTVIKFVGLSLAEPQWPRMSPENPVWLADNFAANNSKNSGAGMWLPDRGGDCGAEVLCAGVAAEVGGARAAFGENLRDCPFDCRRRGALAEVIEHHCA
jgi:hypothetical protein